MHPRATTRRVNFKSTESKVSLLQENIAQLSVFPKLLQFPSSLYCKHGYMKDK
jgi:hypothetical protein